MDFKLRDIPGRIVCLFKGHIPKEHDVVFDWNFQFGDDPRPELVEELNESELKWILCKRCNKVLDHGDMEKIADTLGIEDD